MIHKYKHIGFKLTPQRLAILEYLEDNKEHPSAEDIYRAIITKFPTISLATVYNTLEALKKRGNINELTIDPEKRHFDPNVEPHHHLICVKCKKIVDIDIKFEIELTDDKQHGFEIIGNHIEFYGICPECKKKQ